MKAQNSNVFSKVFLAVLFFSFCSQFTSNAQEGAYWMGLSSKNPALIGTPSDWVWGTAQFADIPNFDGDYNSFALFSDYRISPKAGSVGANFIRQSVGNQTAYIAELLYAYTFKLKRKNRELNIGTSFGVEGLESDYSQYEMELLNSNQKANYLKTNIGFLYHSRKLDLGLNYGGYSELKNEYSSYRLADNYVSFLTAYRFYIKEKFVIEPNIIMEFGNNNDAVGGIHFEYDNFAWLGYETAGTNGLRSVMMGANVSKRFRIAIKYSYSDYYQHRQAKYYRFTLGYKLN